MKLYHATILENKQKIEAKGLNPCVGTLVYDCYGKENVGYVFASDIPNIDRALQAMKNQIFLKYKKELALYGNIEVTKEHIQKYGVLFVILESENEKFSFCTEKPFVKCPIEKNDYFSTENILVEKSISGQDLIDFISKVSPSILEHTICKRSKWGNL